MIAITDRILPVKNLTAVKYIVYRNLLFNRDLGYITIQESIVAY